MTTAVMWRDVAQITINRGAATLLQPISVILFARSLGADQQGVFAVLLTIIITGGQICLLGLDVPLTYITASSPRVGSVAFRRAALAVVLAYGVSVICFSVFPGLLGVFVSVDLGRVETTALLLFSLGSHSLLGLLTGYNVGLGRFRLIMEGSLAQQIILLVLALATSVIGIPVKATTVVAMYTFSLLPNLFLLMRSIQEHSSTAELREVREATLRHQFRLALPHYLSVLASSVALRADIFLLGATMAPAIVGAYSVAKTAAEVVNLIPRSVSPLVTASVAKGMGEEELAPIYKAVITISALGVIGCCVLAAPGVHLLLGHEYQIAVPLLRILVFGSAIVGIWGLFAHHLYGFGNSLVRLQGVVLSITVGLPAMFIAAHKSMPQGVALACVAGSIVALLYVTIRLKRRLAYGLVALVVPRWGDAVRLWNSFAKMSRAK